MCVLFTHLINCTTIGGTIATTGGGGGNAANGEPDRLAVVAPAARPGVDRGLVAAPLPGRDVGCVIGTGELDEMTGVVGTVMKSSAAISPKAGGGFRRRPPDALLGLPAVIFSDGG
jgi:hypothetical protein